jgi:oligoribonuclease NrnB/cAMP/cGMP phosphodiesterase (DHH superfamily)
MKGASLKKIVLYHSGCADGFAAAYVCWLRFGANATYIAVKYGQPVPEIPTDAWVYIVDFSYKREALEDLWTRCAGVTVIDHHKTAAEELAGLEWATFDQNHSGAVLTWKHFFGEDPVPELIRYVEDRDLWRWALPESREVSAALATYPFDFDVWMSLEANVDQLREVGRPIWKLLRKSAEIQAKQAKLMEVGGYTVPVVNATAFKDEVCEVLCERCPDAPFVAAYRDEGDLRRWSLRANGSFDVTTVTKLYRGGGHAAAGGFEQPLSGASPMTAQRAREINSAICAQEFDRMGISNGPAPSVKDYSLEQMLTARFLVDKEKRFNAQGKEVVTVIPAERMVAAVYVAANYEGGSPSQCEPVTLAEGNFVMVLRRDLCLKHVGKESEVAE